MLARLYLKPFKLDFRSMWTKNFQMYKLGFKEGAEAETKSPTFIGSWWKQGSFRKTYFCYIDYAKVFDCVDHKKSGIWE